MYEQKNRLKDAVTAQGIREELLQYAKDFKTSWVSLGQSLYAVWKDKLFLAWSYEKFEYYTERELGIKKEIAMRLLKTYFFLEQDEPDYLKPEFKEDRDAAHVPGCDAINVLRLARQKRELNKSDYVDLKKAVFEKGQEASAVRKDLVALMKKRKEVDPEEEREKRNEAAMRKVLNALRSFQKDMESLKLAPVALLEEATALMKKIEEEID